MSNLDVDNFFSTTKDLRVLVVGDLMLDEYVWGRTERISPEAPVQIVDVVNEDIRLGGAGNVASNLFALGAKVTVASVVGDDQDGQKLHQLAKESSIGVNGLFFEKTRKTTRKTRIISNSQQMLRVDRESRGDITKKSEQRLFDYILSNGAGFNVILLSDYMKGVLTPALLQKILNYGRKYDIPVIVDPKGDNYDKYTGATLLTPNRKEVELATRILLTDEASLLRAGKQLRASLDLDALVVTRSEEGMSIFTVDGVNHLPTRAHEVFDVTGAGDTVLAVLGLGLAAGLNIRDAGWLANVAAGVVVSKIGTSTVTPTEVLGVVRKQRSELDPKIVSRKTMAEISKQKQANGEKIVFTNGCFDLLHVGHVKYLQKARQLGDLLVLGLNSDDSIRRLKGEKRPLLAEIERAQILAALDSVNYVVVFDEDTPYELIDIVRPHVLVKGGDYLPDQVVGKELVESYGGNVQLIQFVDGKSTTDIIDKVLSRYRDEI